MAQGSWFGVQITGCWVVVIPPALGAGYPDFIMKNVEIKARCDESRHSFIRDYLKSYKSAEFRGTDCQTDTYFNVPLGRLKLRSGNIENYLVQYDRPNQAGPKESKYVLVKVEPSSNLLEALTKSLGVLAVVDKKREIYYVSNVKIHLDVVKGLGSFVEVEARDENEGFAIEDLEWQCKNFMKAFEIQDSDLINNSYSDMLLEKRNA